MASLYTRAGSPFFWIKYRTAQGRIEQKSTGCRFGSGPEARRAKQMEAEFSLEELKHGDPRKAHSGWNWVQEFLNVRYAASALSLKRYSAAWLVVKMFVDEHQIESPSAFTRAHCFLYMSWRKVPDKARGKYRACTNTALLEIKVMRIVLQEAVERGIIMGNPCVKLGLKREDPKVKPELTAEQCDLIRQRIPEVKDDDERRMLEISFEIARYQGCRLAETRLNPMIAVDVKNRRIRFRVKGGREFVTLLHEKLVPLFMRLQAEKCMETWSVPKGRVKWEAEWAGNVWFRFMSRIGLKAQSAGICFHSTRVTVVTEMARNNVPESKAQRYVGHSSTTVHRVYQRLRPSDLDDCADAVG